MKLPDKKYEPKHCKTLAEYAQGWNAVINDVKYMRNKHDDERIKKDLLKSQEYHSKRKEMPYFNGIYDCIVEIEKLNEEVKAEHRLGSFFIDSSEALDKLNIRGEQKKAILVIDVGEENIDDLRASITIHPKDYSKSLFTLINCSLKPMPERRYAIQGMIGYEGTKRECKGYNRCIDEILGEEE